MPHRAAQTQREKILERARADGYLIDEADIYEDHERGHKLTRKSSKLGWPLTAPSSPLRPLQPHRVGVDDGSWRHQHAPRKSVCAPSRQEVCET